jgi:hypothetical protein
MNQLAIKLPKYDNLKTPIWAGNFCHQLHIYGLKNLFSRALKFKKVTLKYFSTRCLWGLGNSELA